MRLRFVPLAVTALLAIASCSSTAGPPPPGPPGPSAGPAPINPNPNPAPPPEVTPAPQPTTPPIVDPAPAAAVPAALTPVPAPPAPGAPPPAMLIPAAPPAPPILAARPYQDIIKLKQAGLTDEFLLNKIRTENVDYQLTTSDILDLRNAGLSEAVIEAMLRSGRPASATAGTPLARRAEFAGLARVGKGFLVFGTSTSKNVGRLVIDGGKISWFESEDPKKNFSIYATNVKEIFNTCVLRPGENLCLEFGIVTLTGEDYRFRDPGWKYGENRLVSEATTYFRQAFPNLFFSRRDVSEM